MKPADMYMSMFNVSFSLLKVCEKKNTTVAITKHLSVQLLTTRRNNSYMHMRGGLSCIEYFIDFTTVSIMMMLMDTLRSEEASTCQASMGILGQSDTIV